MSGWGSAEVWVGPNPGKKARRKSVAKNGPAVKSAGTPNEAGGVAEKAVVVDEELDAGTVGFGAASGSSCTSWQTARRVTNALTRNMAGMNSTSWNLGVETFMDPRCVKYIMHIWGVNQVLLPVVGGDNLCVK